MSINGHAIQPYQEHVVVQRYSGGYTANALGLQQVASGRDTNSALASLGRTLEAHLKFIEERAAPDRVFQRLQRCSDRGRRSLAAHLGHYRRHHGADPQPLKFTFVNVRSDRTLKMGMTSRQQLNEIVGLSQLGCVEHLLRRLLSSGEKGCRGISHLS